MRKCFILEKRILFIAYAMVLQCLNVKGQATSISHFGTSTVFDWCGWDAASIIPFHLEHRGNQDINFLTGNIQRMTIRGTAAAAQQGFVGIGTAAPANLFEVNGGNINLQTITNAYKLNNRNILWHKGDISSLFVGVDAGVNHSFSLPSENTFLGYQAGFSSPGNNPGFPSIGNVLVGYEAGFNTISSGNTYVGWRAGYSHNNNSNGFVVSVGYESGFLNQDGDNAFYGSFAARNHVSGSGNSVFGHVAGEFMNNCNDITIMGLAAGQNNSGFSRNNYFGARAGATTIGEDNVFIGTDAGVNGVGYKNVLVGNNAMQAATAGTNNVVVGFNANSASPGTSFNTIIGGEAALANSTGANNTFLGFQSAVAQTSGTNNAYLGFQTGINLLTGSNNTFLGARADATNPASNLTNAAAIGGGALVTNSNHMILGNNNVNVGIGLSADAVGPQNKLEINTAVANTSGLRFRQLTSASPLVANPGQGVLSVDANGDVIYVQGPNPNSGFGNLCSNAQNPITGDFEMPLNSFIYRFTGQGDINNTTKEDVVAIGYACNQIPPSRFSVLEDQINQPQVDQTYAAHFKNANIPTGIFSGSILETAGIYAEAKGPIVAGVNNLNINIGGIFEGYGQINNIGTVGRISKSSTPLSSLISGRYNIGGAFFSDTTVANNATPATDNFGVFARATNGQINKYGVYAEVDAANQGFISAAVYAVAPAPNPNFTTPTGEYAGYFDGDVFVNGQFAFASDQNLKQNIDTINNPLGLINQLKPRTFDYKVAQYPHMNFPSDMQYGLIAQDVQTVIPTIITDNVHPAKYDSQGNIINPSVSFKGIEYNQLIPILIGAVQQLSAQNQKLDSMLIALTQTVNACCSNSNARTTGIQGNQPNAISQLNIDLSDKDVIVLNQNVPNPFAEQTTITYNVPEKYGFAQLVFKTIDGKIIKTVDITKKGRGQVNVFANDLSNGLYMYSLVVDGVVVDTKKMVKQ